MSEKSIAILGKGPSVSRCTKEFIDSFDEVAACGRPVFSGYDHVIGSRAKYDFANRTASPYTQEEKSRLGIEHTIDTGSNTAIRENFSYKNLDPSSGILVFDYFLKQDEYTEIALIGFDLFQTMEKMYYFKNEEFDPALEWLWNDGTYDTEGRLTIVSGHKTEETFDYLNDMFDLHSNKKFHIISSYPFKEKDNVVIFNKE